MESESPSFSPDFFDSSAEQFGGTKFFPAAGIASSDDIFSILEALEGASSSGVQELVEAEAVSQGTKRQKVSPQVEESRESLDDQLKTNHVTVNRRKTMNDHLAILRSLMPCFYVKRGDQASIIGGVIDYITELQQVLQSLEAKKKRKVYSDHVLSPRLISSPRTLPLSPRKPPLSPRPSLPISPRTPQSARHRLLFTTSYPLSLSPMANTTPASPCNSSSNSDTINELVANSTSSIADVEVKFSGANLLLKTVSRRLPGQATKIISVLEDLSLEILQATINTADETMVNSFTIKIGIECKIMCNVLGMMLIGAKYNRLVIEAGKIKEVWYPNNIYLEQFSGNERSEKDVLSSNGLINAKQKTAGQPENYLRTYAVSFTKYLIWCPHRSIANPSKHQVQSEMLKSSYRVHHVVILTNRFDINIIHVDIHVVVVAIDHVDSHPSNTPHY
ncbi:hypothetical protein L1987_62543 [Smallanthus sonchifolius]|uniref:Uncharacterized protein n=1 Tax=Smallanthus sonchifolius TaxID=185202 RepID=A0ACB9CAW2_9ASTR|nr:hypothetical protein L1987_62543 [Smallanthus sonchifolius]